MVAAIFALALADVPALPKLDDARMKELHRLVIPTEDELTFDDVEWRPVFWDAVTEAQRQEKPILLWAMNGHPMACT